VSKTLDVAVGSSAEADKTVEGDSDPVSLESAAASSETVEPSVADSDVLDLGASSAPYIPSGLADAAGVTETDATGDTGATAAADTALLHTEDRRVRNYRLEATGDTHTANGLEVVASDTETDDTGESGARGTSDPSSDPTASAVR